MDQRSRFTFKVILVLNNSQFSCFKNKLYICRCPPTEFTNRQDLEKFEPQSSSQSSEPVDYGTQPDAEIRSYEDYDWVQDRMVKYRRNDNDGLDRF